MKATPTHSCQGVVYKWMCQPFSMCTNCGAVGTNLITYPHQWVCRLCGHSENYNNPNFFHDHD